MLVLPDTPTCQAHAHLRARVSTRPGGVQSANTRFSETTPVIMRENETTEITSPPPRYRLQGRQPITQSGTSPACPLIKGSDAGLKAPSTRRSATSWRGRQPITRSDTCLRAHVRGETTSPPPIPPPRSDTGCRARQPITRSDAGPRARRLTTPPPSPLPETTEIMSPPPSYRLQGPSTDHSVRQRPSSPCKTMETTSPPPSYRLQPAGPVNRSLGPTPALEPT